MTHAYYNENDPKAAEWIRQLIKAGLIEPGDVDERSIEDVRPADLTGYRQAHFFAGIGGWPYALRLAGWPDDRPVWTGSCPCQPFSQAGTGKGTDDPRHLWPHWRWLIDQQRPAIIFGEQVASKDGRHWLAGVRADLETLGYGFGAADLCAAGIGAPHIRQRLWWMADADGRDASTEGLQRGRQHGCESQDSGIAGRLGEPDSPRREPGQQAAAATRHGHPTEPASGDGRLRNANEPGSQGRGILPERTNELSAWATSLGNWLPCTDGKARRIEPGIEPLVNGLPGRVGLLRGYGNAIVPQVAATFIEAVTDCQGQKHE